MKAKLLFLSLMYCSCLHAQSSLQLDKTKTVQYLVENVLIKAANSNVVISDIKHNLNGSSGIAAFKDNNSAVGISEGILLSTGNVNVAIGPNNSGNLGSNNNPSLSDTDLGSISGGNVLDASVLEFDFVPLFDNVSFRYVFSSEEYNEFVCSRFNDAFGFFISEESNGVFINKRNLALIPGSTLPVSINSVNNGTVGSSGLPSTPTCKLTNSQFFVNNTNSSLPSYTHIQYDGFTVVLTASVNLVPNKTYHFKFAVGDVGDDALDSGVFLEGGSFVSCDKSTISGLSNVCPESPIVISSDIVGGGYKWYFNNVVFPLTTKSISVTEQGTYKVEVTKGACKSISDDFVITSLNCDKFTCAECVPSFSPEKNNKYLLSAWVKETYTDKYPDTYAGSGIKITFNAGTNTSVPMMRPSGPIIDGWQRIEASFTVPSDANNIQIELINDNAPSDVFFDDIRVHPFRSNMKSFVYDPSTQRLIAELDENNYSTRYEYDDEGILIRVKKETERGVMTIKETRNNQSKINTR